MVEPDLVGKPLNILLVSFTNDSCRKISLPRHRIICYTESGTNNLFFLSIVGAWLSVSAYCEHPAKGKQSAENAMMKRGDRSLGGLIIDNNHRLGKTLALAPNLFTISYECIRFTTS